MENIKWFRKKVLHGDKGGRKIGFPTVNLSTANFGEELKDGVYACLVKYHNKIHKGSLFYGPRLVKAENYKVLEIYIHDFTQTIYGKFIEFSIVSFLREVKNFKNFNDLKKQIQDDINKSNTALIKFLKE